MIFCQLISSTNEHVSATYLVLTQSTGDLIRLRDNDVSLDVVQPKEFCGATTKSHNKDPP